MTEGSETKSFREIISGVMLQTVPSYANKIYYSMGFLSMTSLLILIISGIVLAFNGPNWWLINDLGIYVRSVHLWASEAFIFFIIVHLLVVFLTAGFRASRRLTWVLGALMFFLALVEAEFGFGLRGDFSSQWRSLQAADLYNGSGLGIFINNLNYAQIYGIHLVVIPALIMFLLFCHYLLVRARGIATPDRADVNYRMVPANHRILFARGTVLVALILILAYFFKSPTILPVTIAEVAQTDPSLFGKTIQAEYDRTSDTAKYLDSIDPYNFDTRTVYVLDPYRLDAKERGTFDITAGQSNLNPGQLGTVKADLTRMAVAGNYESALRASLSTGYNPTYVTRFLADTGVLKVKATALGLTTDQYGMLREESASMPLGAWWLTPLGVLDHTALAGDPNQDRDGAEILGLLVLLLIAYPYIPFFNRLPDYLKVYKLIWR